MREISLFFITEIKMRLPAENKKGEEMYFMETVRYAKVLLERKNKGTEKQTVAVPLGNKH